MPGGAESAMAGGRKCACGISGKRLVAIFYFYAANSKAVRRERRCEKVDGDASRIGSGGGERGGVLTAARGTARKSLRQARAQRPTL